MNTNVMPFKAGRQKYIVKGQKVYIAKLVRHGQVRYSRACFAVKRASEAQEYAERWARRAEAFLALSAMEAVH